MSVPTPLSRRHAALALVAATGLLGSAGFSAAPALSQTTDNSSPSLSGMHITYVGVNDPVYNAIGCGAKDRVLELGGSFDQQNAQLFSAASQTPVVNAAIASHPDGLITSPADPVGLSAPLQAAGPNIPIVTVLNTLQDRTPVTSEVDYDNLAAGRAAADYLAQQAGDQQVKVAAFSFTKGASEAADAEVTGFEQELQQYPNVEYLGVQYAGAQDTSGVTTQELNAVLSANPDLFGVFTHAGDTGAGALAALRQRHSQAMLVANYSTTTEVLANALQDGEVAAIVSFPFRQSGVMAADALAEKLSGQPVQDTYSLEPVVYTQASFSDPVQSTDLQPPSC